MMRVIAVLFFGLVALVVVVAAGMIYLMKFNNQSLLAKDLKKIMLHYPAFVSLINLNQPGDAKYIYLDPKVNTIYVNMVYTSQANPSGEVDQWLNQIIKQTTGKEINLNLALSPTVSSQESFSDADLNRIRKEVLANSKTPLLNVIYLTTYKESPGFLGLTMHRDTIFIFKKTLTGLSQDSEIIKRLEESTLMHEWGHLLGLSHVDQPGCIMSDYIETYENRQITLVEIPLTHCWSTDYDLEKIKKEIE